MEKKKILQKCDKWRTWIVFVALKIDILSIFRIYTSEFQFLKHAEVKTSKNETKFCKIFQESLSQYFLEVTEFRVFCSFSNIFYEVRISEGAEKLKT